MECLDVVINLITISPYLTVESQFTLKENHHIAYFMIKVILEEIITMRKIGSSRRQVQR